MMTNQLEELKYKIDSLFEPDIDDESGVPIPRFPHRRLLSEHDIDTSYWMPNEHWVTHRNRRICRTTVPQRMKAIMKNLDLFYRLFTAGLRLLGDSILEYHGRSERVGVFRYYPPIVLTLLSAFESLVAHASEKLIVTVPNIPEPVKAFLLEYETIVQKDGSLKKSHRFRPVLDRYWLALKYGYNYEANRGGHIWQRAKAVLELRNRLAHPKVTDTLSISSKDVLESAENLLLLLIGPSAALGKTLEDSQYELYDIVAELWNVIEPFEEHPMFSDWPFEGKFIFSCNFDNIDKNTFPSYAESVEDKIRKAPSKSSHKAE